MLDHSTPELQLLQRVRDEAHRFAVTHHRTRRDRAMTASLLDDLPGIGPARKRALLTHFGSPEAVLAAASARSSRRCRACRGARPPGNLHRAGYFRHKAEPESRSRPHAALMPMPHAALASTVSIPET